MKEKDLFPPLKKSFKELGYTVYAEVPYFYRGIDFVAVKGEDHIAVEMKMSFSHKVISQANLNSGGFGKNYVAFPVKKPILYNDDLWKREKLLEKFELCRKMGIGIYQVLPSGIIFEAMEARYKKPYRIFDFSQYEENDNDEAGIPCQKGVSMGYMELKAIKAYVQENPNASWREIYENVQNHYSSPSSLSGSMSQWRGFTLREYKRSLKLIK